LGDHAVTTVADMPTRAATELRLARLAARLVLAGGVASGRHEVGLAAARAEAALQRIAAAAGRPLVPPEPASRRHRPRPPSARRAHALALNIMAKEDGPVPPSRPDGNDGPAPPDASVRNTEAMQLLMLLALTPAALECQTAPAMDPTGRALLLLLLPETPLRQRFLSPSPPPQQAPTTSPHLRRYPLALVLYSVAIVAYLLLRFRGHYVEQDTAEMTQLIEAVAAYGSAIPSAAVHPVYPFGFGFQAVNLYLMRLSGTSIQTLQAWVWPFLAVGLALVAFLTFREITADDRAAALGGLFLFMQPDFLFTALRGSHEKMTYCMLLAALLLLFRSYRFRHRLRVFAAHVALFYLVMFGIACTNSTFGSSLIVALTVSFFGGALVSRLVGRGTGAGNRAFIRLAYVSFSSSLVLVAELFYFYSPSIDIFNQFKSAIDRIAGFALNFDAGSNPYAYISQGWLSVHIYLLLTSFTWLILAISGIAWCLLTGRFFRGGWPLAPDRVRLCWLLYAGLTMQVGVGIAIDAAGVLGANLQLRLIPVFMFIAIPISSSAVVHLLDRAAGRPLLRQCLRGGLALTTIAFTAFSVLKATNEPLLSNKWTFYSTAEAQAMDWLAIGVPQGGIWSDIDERLREVDLFRSPPTEAAASRYPTLLPPEQLDVVMLSRITRERMARLDVPLPDLPDMNELYDNGLVQIYRQLPRTPLQR
jgi:hypothetical protein